LRVQSKGAILNCLLKDESDQPSVVFKTHGSLTLEVEVQINEPIKNCSLGFTINDELGSVIFASHLNQYQNLEVTNPSVIRFRATMPTLPLSPGLYSISLFLSSERVDYDQMPRAITFEVVWDASLSLKYPPHVHWGVLFIPVEWSVAR